MNTANRLRFSEAETALFFIPDHSDFCFRFFDGIEENQLLMAKNNANRYVVRKHW